MYCKFLPWGRSSCRAVRWLCSFQPLAMAFLWVACFHAPIRGDTPPQYNRDVRPILAENCFACHGPDSAARQADLRLDQRDAAIEAGAIQPGQSGESELIARIFDDDPELVMPPSETKKSLSAAQKETLRRWIDGGAEYQPHWSFIPPERPALPPVHDAAWVKNPIDRFVLAKLESLGMQPAPEADARTLFRRLHLDVTGLPPSPADVDAFVEEYRMASEDAMSRWIDRLMQTPAWGEHRARYWLDAARYGDTHGFHFDNYREMWPYRDWVIRAFADNKPFDQFTIEQIAGDLLPHPSDAQRIATGFQRCNMTTNEGGTIDEENMAIYATDRVQTFGWVYLGLTTNCGQCHDHKFDPFTQRDYYSLAAFFRNTTQPAKDGNVKDGRGAVVVVPSLSDEPRWSALPGEIAAATSKLDERRNVAHGDFSQWLENVTPESLDESLPTEGLLVHVPLNEGAGNEVGNTCQTPAKSSATFHATGELTWIPEGKIGPAAVIQSGSTLDLGDLGDFEKNQTFSYGGWIKAASDSASAGIIARMNEAASFRGWDLWQQGRTLAVHIIDAWPDNAIKVATRDPVVQPGQWQHVFVTYDGSATPAGVKIYVNGTAVALNVETNTLQPDATIRTDTALRIGQRSGGQVFEGGAVQDVRVYQRALAATEVLPLVEIAPLKSLLISSAERTVEQQKSLYDFYLVTYDQQYPKLAKAVTKLEAERDAIRARSPITHVQEERDSPPMAHILARGEYDRPGEQVAAATPLSLHAMPADAPRNRLGLAQWLVDRSNPLTARVTINRFWQQVFGRGIVSTTEDFGVMGALPSHPELMDWLAVEFRESGWDVKSFFKLVLTSATYRQAAVTTPDKLERDRDNVWLSRGPRFRMDAEMVRDYALAASGLLSTKLYGPSVKPYQPDDLWNIVGLPGGDTRNFVQDTGENLYRRTLYTFWKRMSPPPNLEAFNAPSREVCTVRRERTNTPLQALVTLNDPQFVEAARHLAERAMHEGAADDVQTLEFIAQSVLSRSWSPQEQTMLLADQQEFVGYYETRPEDARALVTVGESKPDDTLPVVSAAAWTMVCNEVLNLDETLNK